MHAGVLQDHVPEQVLGSGPQMRGQAGAVEFAGCLVHVPQPLLVEFGPFVADRGPLADDLLQGRGHPAHPGARVGPGIGVPELGDQPV